MCCCWFCVVCGVGGVWYVCGVVVGGGWCGYCDCVGEYVWFLCGGYLLLVVG